MNVFFAQNVRKNGSVKNFQISFKEIKKLKMWSKNPWHSEDIFINR